MSGASHKLCVDIDNVIAQTDEVMRDVIREYTGGRVQLAHEDVREFDYCDCQDKNGNRINREDWNIVHHLFTEPRYLLQIRPLPGAIEGMHQLARKATLHIATSRLPKARRTTIEWLEKYCFPDHDLHFVKHNEKHISLGSFFAVVEDHYEQAVKFVKGGTTCFLLRHPWNESKPQLDGIQWVDSWAELTERFLSMIRDA